VQSFRATTECEFDLARKQPGRAMGLRPWIPKQLLEYFSCAAEALPLDPAERKSKGENSTPKAFPARDHPSDAVLKAIQGAAWKRRRARSMAERRPASALAGVGNPRSGRKKACGAVEPKKAQARKNLNLALTPKLPM